MRSSASSRFLVVIAVFALLAGGCSRFRADSRGSNGPKPPHSELDTVYTSPTGLYTIRANRSWPVQEIATPGGIGDFYTVDSATFAVLMDKVLPGTTLERMVQSTVAQYKTAHIQDLERVGTVNVGGGKGELLRAVTYVTADGSTSASAPAPGAKPRTLYQVLYLAGDQSFTFSIAWPQSDKTDYLSLFRSMLQTFTLAGAS